MSIQYVKKVLPPTTILCQLQMTGFISALEVSTPEILDPPTQDSTEFMSFLKIMQYALGQPCLLSVDSIEDTCNWPFPVNGGVNSKFNSKFPFNSEVVFVSYACFTVPYCYIGPHNCIPCMVFIMSNLLCDRLSAIISPTKGICKKYFVHMHFVSKGFHWCENLNFCRESMRGGGRLWISAAKLRIAAHGDRTFVLRCHGHHFKLYLWCELVESVFRLVTLVYFAQC